MSHPAATPTIDSADAAPPRPWHQERAQDAVRKTYSRFAAAWSDGNVDQVATLLASDCDHVTLARAGRVRRGRAELVDTWRAAFARRCPSFSIRMTTELRSIRLVGDRLSIVDGEFQYSEGVGTEGARRRQCAQPFSAVMTRGESHWLILSIRVGAPSPLPCGAEN